MYELRLRPYDREREDAVHLEIRIRTYDGSVRIMRALEGQETRNEG